MCLFQSQMQENPHWVLSREEVEETIREVGSGGWGVVKFRGLCVAAKRLHISNDNRDKLAHELTIAAKLRHPNVLLFIGATIEENPLILTEMMPTCLRKKLENTEIPPINIISISQDVARALCYLHQWRPNPIVHLNINIDNVLLEVSSTPWRAKVSNYGSANFMNNVTTAGLRSLACAAPDSNMLHQQLPQNDVFSFGLLLVDMLVRKLPESQPLCLEDRIQSIQWPAMLSLIRACTIADPVKCPNMSDVLEQLDTIKQ